MEYQVPQFIDVESKIIGPLTLKQFIYIAGGAGLCIIIFHFLPFFVAILVCLPVAGFAGALAFYKINNKPFITVVESAFRFYTSSRLFLWRKEQKNITAEKPEVTLPTNHDTSVRLTRGKLHELAWSLDVQKHVKTPT